jgi:hypothetical protein
MKLLDVSRAPNEVMEPSLLGFRDRADPTILHIQISQIVGEI